MANFNPTIITDSGLSLIAKISSGSGQMSFTRICTSKSSYSVDEAQHLSALTTIEQETTIDKVEIINDTAVKVSAVITNKLLESGYYINAIGLYAEDPDLGEILYSITIAKVPDWMQPDSGSGVSSLLIQLITQVSNSSIVKTELNPSVLATVQDLEDLKNSLPASFVNYLGEITDVTNILNNPEYGDYPYEGIISSEVATSIGLSSDIDTEWSIKCFRATEGSGFQIAVPIYYDSGESPKYRIAAKRNLNGNEYIISWGRWNNFSDGGNAELFSGNSIDEFLKYNGVATDCNECTTRGVYHTNESTLNIPSGVLISLLYTPILFVIDETCQLFFTDTEIYKRSGTLLDGGSYPDWKSWNNVSDGGNASTVGGKSLSDLMVWGMSYDERTKITSGDLNDYTKVGSYVVTSADTAAAIENSPWTKTGYFLDVYYRITGYCVQVAMTWDGYIKIRALNANTWYEWRDIVQSNYAASSTNPGIVTTSMQHFKGQKYFEDNVWIPNPDIIMGEGAPSADTSRAFVFTSSDNSLSNASAWITNVARASGNNELYLTVRSLTSKTLINGLAIRVNADNTNWYTFVSNPPQSTQVALRNISSGKSEVSTTNCPSGSWYGKHD